MQQPPDNPDFAFEYLDPEPPANEGSTQLRELLLGLMLLIAVLGWGGWQWWQQSGKENSYSAAEVAAARKDWDHARAGYAAASGYKDSDSKAKAAAQLILQRDTQYTLATAAASRHDWAASLQALQAVRAIQPGYRDTDTLAAEDEKQVYNEALGGTIVLRSHAQPPGLYYRKDGTWIWLQGSDRCSAVRGSGTPDHVVYDVPAEGEAGYCRDGVLTGSSQGQAPGSGNLSPQGRKLMAASLQSSGMSFSPLALDPASFTQYVWSIWGVWAWRSGPNVTPDNLRQYGGVWAGAFGQGLIYEAFGSAITSTVTLPGRDWRLMDFSPAGDYILLSDQDAHFASGGGSRLYLADVFGGHLQLLYSAPGGTASAQFSPDGHYVLLVGFSQNPTNYMTVNQTAILLDAESGAPPVVLGQGTTDQTGWAFYPAVNATFITSGPYTGDLLLAEWSGTESNFSLLDPASPGIAILEGTLQGNNVPPGSAWVAGTAPDKSLLLVWQQIVAREPLVQRMTAVKLSPGQPALTIRIDPPPVERESLTGAWIRDGRLVYSTRTFTPNNRQGDTYSVYSVLLSALDAREAGAALVGSGTVSGVSSFPTSATGVLGPGMLAYMSAGELHARTYDGSADVSLEGGITYFFSFNRYEDIHTLR